MIDMINQTQKKIESKENKNKLFFWKNKPFIFYFDNTLINKNFFIPLAMSFIGNSQHTHYESNGSLIVIFICKQNNKKKQTKTFF